MTFDPQVDYNLVLGEETLSDNRTCQGGFGPPLLTETLLQVYWLLLSNSRLQLPPQIRIISPTVRVHLLHPQSAC